jgi:transposase
MIYPKTAKVHIVEAMSNTEKEQNEQATWGVRTAEAARMRIPEIAKRLDIGRLAVYDLLDQGIIPGIRLATARANGGS